MDQDAYGTLLTGARRHKPWVYSSSIGWPVGPPTIMPCASGDVQYYGINFSTTKKSSVGDYPSFCRAREPIVDDVGVKHTWTKAQPKIVAGTFDAIALLHMGMDPSQIIGTFGERGTSGSNVNGYYHNGNLADHGNHSSAPYDRSNFPMDPTAEERTMLAAMLDLSPRRRRRHRPSGPTRRVLQALPPVRNQTSKVVTWTTAKSPASLSGASLSGCSLGAAWSSCASSGARSSSGTSPSRSTWPNAGRRKSAKRGRSKHTAPTPLLHHSYTAPTSLGL